VADWGKINRGARFVMLTVDILRAVSVVNWGRYEWPIIGYLIEHSWGTATRTGKRGQYGDPEPCDIPMRPLAKAAGFPHPRLVEAKRDLIAGHVMVPCGAGWTFNKAAEQWTEADGETPRLSPEMVAYCHGTDLQPVRPSVPPPGTPQRTTPVRPSVPPGTPQRTTCTKAERTRDSEDELDYRQTEGAAGRKAILFDPEGVATGPVEPPPTTDDEQRHARLRQIIDAARAAAGEPGERWAATYAHEYPDHARLLKAINQAGDVSRAGVKVRSFGGLVRAKYEAAESSGRNGAAAVDTTERDRAFAAAWEQVRAKRCQSTK
jgi:hypothetical protein